MLKPAPEPGFAQDSPLEGRVSCELVSEMPEFPASWENTGNFADSGLAGTSEAAKSARNQFLTGQFPTHPDREFFAALQGIKSGDQGSFRRDRGIPPSSAILAFAPGDKSDRPDKFPTLPRRRKRRRQIFEVAEADLELDAGFCPCERCAGHAEIARRTRRRERSAFRGGIGRVARRQLS